MTDRVLSGLSLAAKAGKVRSGETAAEEALRSGNAYLLLMAQDASENTKKKFRSLSARLHVPYVQYADRERIGHAIGKEYRSAAAVTDKNMADLIRGAFDASAGGKQEGFTNGKYKSK